jgi:PAS domain S-box-containing protein
MLFTSAVQEVLDVAPDAMVFLDEEGSILFANRQVRALFGYSPEDLRGRPIEWLLPERLRDRHVAHRRDYFRSLRLRPMGIGLELLARRADGSEFPVEISLSPIRDGDGITVAAAVRDATERRTTERQLQLLRDEAQRASQAKSRFLATASHDLRQPLQALSLLNGALAQHVDGEGAEILEQQAQAIATMSRLLNALLDVSKLESGRVTPELADVPVRNVLDDLCLEFSGLASSKGLELTVQACPDTVRTDPALIAQALRNLLANAVKYTDRGSIGLSAERCDQGVRIAVRDTGVGIPPEQLPLIFDEFYQVGGAANARREGYGLGLSIVRRVVDLLGISIDVESTPGAGTVFTLTLPPGAGDQEPVRRKRAPGRPAPAARGTPLPKVLLVEDDAAVRRATRMFLQAEGFAVAVASSPPEAADLLAQDPWIDLVITDYHLDGDRTGLEVVRHARELRGLPLPAILLTGDTSTAVRSLEGDPKLRIASKPVDPDVLLAMIDELVDGRSVARADT